MSDCHRIHRHNYESFYTVFSNSLWESEFLSWGAKSLLAYMLSRPKNWVVYRGQLASIYKGDKRGNGKDAVDSWFKELIDQGYIVYTPQDEKSGKFIHRYDVYPEPSVDFKEKIPEGVKPLTGKTPRGLNSLQTSNDISTSNDEDNNPPSEDAPAAIIIFSILESLQLSNNKKYWVIEKLQEIEDCLSLQERADLLVKRVLRWEGRENDIVGVHTVLKYWIGWGDNKSPEEIFEANNEFLDSILEYDGKKVNGCQIYIGKMSDGRYIEFILGAKVEQFKTTNPKFIKSIVEFYKNKFNINLENRGYNE